MDNIWSGLLIVMIIIIIVLIAVMMRRLSLWGPKNLTYYQKCARDEFKDVSGDQWQAKNQSTIDYAASIPEEKRTAFDHFMVGATYMYGRRYPKRIAKNYGRALEEIKKGNVFKDERMVILDRIRDHIEYHPEPYAIEELEELKIPVAEIYNGIRPNHQLEMAVIENFRDNKDNKKYDAINSTKREEKIEKSVTRAEKIENMKPIIRTDGENTHSSAVTLEFAKQYKKIRVYNDLEARNLPVPEEVMTGLRTINTKLEQDLNKTAHSEAMMWLSSTYGKEHPTKWNEIRRRFCNDFSLVDVSEPSRPNIAEHDVIAAVWRRIHSKDNAERKEELLEMLTNQVDELVKNGKSVCTSGRTENVVATLATLDADPSLGIFKTDEMIKQQMYETASKVINEEIEKLPEDEKKAYNTNTTESLPPEKLEHLKGAVDQIIEKTLSEVCSKFASQLPYHNTKQIRLEIANVCRF